MGRLVVAVLVVGFTVYCVIDALRSQPQHVRGLPRPVWIVLILVVPVIGGVLWLVAGRPRSGGGGGRGGRPRHAGTPPSPPPVRGPDDDPDFLRGLDRRLREEGSGGSGRTERPGAPDGRDEPGTPGEGGDAGGQGTGAGGTDRR